jgi:hypothetical protein
VCPQCGSGDQVRTVREFFDMMNGARDQAMQRAAQLGFGGPQQPQGWNQGQPPMAGGSDDGDYNHYNVEGSDRQLRRGRNWNSGRRDTDFDFGGDNIAEDIGGAVFGVALGFAGRAIGKRMKQAFEDKVVPAMQARAAQSQQQWEQSKSEQDAIVARYPELRGCMKDQVIFLDGGQRRVPFSELKQPVTLAQADAIVAQLR